MKTILYHFSPKDMVCKPKRIKKEDPVKVTYRKVLPIRPRLNPKWLGIKTPFSKKYRQFEKKLWSNFDNWTRSWDRKIEKFDDRFGRQIFHFLQKKPYNHYFWTFSQYSKTQFVLLFIRHNNKYSVNNNNNQKNIPLIGFKPNFEKSLARSLSKVT